jgi:hypothetical protein
VKKNKIEDAIVDILDKPRWFLKIEQRVHQQQFPYPNESQGKTMCPSTTISVQKSNTRIVFSSTMYM